MSHVKAGSPACKSRRQSASERLEKHLKNHRSFHRHEETNRYALTDEAFKTHEEKQKKELEVLKDRLV